MLVLNQREVRELLDLDRLVDALADAHAELTAGKTSMPPRIAALVPDRDALLGVMPAYLPSAGLACKLVTLFPRNRDRETHQAAIVVFDPDNGTPLALMDGTYVTATRTAAGSALATRLLAREDARVLALIGTGVQARTHARAIRRVRPIEEIRVAGRDRAKAEALADELGPHARPAKSYEEAIRGADVRDRAGRASGVARPGHARQLRRTESVWPGARRGDRGRRHARRRVARVGARTAARRRTGAGRCRGRRRPCRARRAGRRREGRAVVAGRAD